MLKKVLQLTLLKKKKKDFFNMQKSKERGTVCLRDSQPGYFLLRFVRRPWMKHLARDEFG